MATKSKAAAAKETDEKIEAVAEEVKELTDYRSVIKQLKDEWDETVDMVVPRKPRGEDQQYYICVNDRRYLVPADGKVQTLPKPVAEVLRESIEADAEADEFADHIPNRSADQHAIRS
jgi:hypothetical protein